VSLIFGTLANLFFKISLLDNVIAGLTAVLSTVYLAHDTQLIIGGKHHSKQYGPKDYILPALNLYQDIINLFIQILKLLEKNNKSKKR
jgi:FtsH-binding integral membrane protein